MAITNSARDMSADVIEEYLVDARVCVNTQKPGGGSLGYPATLPLLCIVDSIGNALLPYNRQSTRPAGGTVRRSSAQLEVRHR